MSFDVPGGFISVMSPVYPPLAMPSRSQEAVQSAGYPYAPAMAHAYTHPPDHDSQLGQYTYSPQASHPSHPYPFSTGPEQHDRDIAPLGMPEHDSSPQVPYVYPQAYHSDNSLPTSDIEELYYNGPTSPPHPPAPNLAEHQRPSFESFSSTPPLLYYAQLNSQHQVKTHGFRAGVRRGLEKAHIHVHKKSIGEALAHNASLASTIPVPTGAPIGTQSTPALDASYIQPRSSPNAASSSLKTNFHKRRPDPNYCRMRDCGRLVARIPSLGGCIEWCGHEHMKEGMQRYGLKACKRCRTNPRRWDDKYCCPACADR
ncbi:unnamed protein product [Peniophora sp. CBMAI 1063]|nr:unnamed protein product [Peniophora sp. CBMAI 1063]